jgi:5-enolpyruvylshikimate-3-phosphate synthase
MLNLTFNPINFHNQHNLTIQFLVVAAAFAKGTTIIKDAAELRVKKCDRFIEIFIRYI